MRRFVTGMRRVCLGAALLSVLAAAGDFTVSLPKSWGQKTLDGRLLLLLSTDPSAEPRFQINDSPKT